METCSLVISTKVGPNNSKGNLYACSLPVNWFFILQNMIKPGMVPHYFNPSISETEAFILLGGMHGYSGINSEF